MPGTAPPPAATALVSSPLGVLAVLLFVLAGLFALKKIPAVARLFNVVPLVVFCYFVPTILSNTGVIPTDSELYAFVTRLLLPAKKSTTASRPSEITAGMSVASTSSSRLAGSSRRVTKA